MSDRALFFASPTDFRAWLDENHRNAVELWVGYWKKGSGVASITWPESVDEALCFGWIDGLRRSIDERRYKIRFTPRRKGSRWSRVNVDKMGQLEEQGRLTPAGREAFAALAEDGTYSYEQREAAVLAPQFIKALHADPVAWVDFSKRPPGYRRNVAFWVMSAKREATRERRFQTLLECSRDGRKVPPLAR